MFNAIVFAALSMFVSRFDYFFVLMKVISIVIFEHAVEEVLRLSHEKASLEQKVEYLLLLSLLFWKLLAYNFLFLQGVVALQDRFCK